MSKMVTVISLLFLVIVLIGSITIGLSFGSSGGGDGTGGGDDTSEDDTSEDDTSGDDTSGDDTSGDDTSGDGDGADNELQPDPNPCIENPNAEGCEENPCVEDPTLGECEDPCVEDPTLGECEDPCVEDPTLGECEPEKDCDPSYPNICVPSPPPDLNCNDVPNRNFKVVGSDPHGFDGDNDGIGCDAENHTDDNTNDRDTSSITGDRDTANCHKTVILDTKNGQDAEITIERGKSICIESQDGIWHGELCDGSFGGSTKIDVENARLIYTPNDDAQHDFLSIINGECFR